MSEIEPGIAGLILCGGKSSRMGQPKEMLELGGESFLGRTLHVLSRVVSPIVVVAAENQTLPELPANVLIARDHVANCGPLAGIASGLRRLQSQATTTGRPLVAAYVTSCDTPLLRAEFVRALIHQLDSHDAAVPREGEHLHPLAGVYRLSVAQAAERLLGADRLRVTELLAETNTHQVDVEQLRRYDPQLDSLRNVNTPEQYRELVQRMAGEG